MVRNPWPNGRFDFVRLLSTSGFIALCVTLLAPVSGWGAEHVTLRNGFEQDCARIEAVNGRVRLYPLPVRGTKAGLTLEPEQQNYFEVDSEQIVRVEELPDVLPSPADHTRTYHAQKDAAETGSTSRQKQSPKLSWDAMHPLLADAQARHNVDADLLWSVVKAESGGQVRAVSHAGAQGLMQLMPGTAAELGVVDSFQPEQNIGGGAAYLDQMLTRYHDNLMLALAAYNAGPAAVDRWHGVPPYRETRAYVERVIHEFNTRKQMMTAKTGPQLALAR